MKKSQVTTAVILASAIMMPMMASASSCCGAPAPTGKSLETMADKKEAEKVVAQTTCPVMGGAVDKNLYVDHDGKRIYVCCQGCIAKVTKEPATYVKKLEDAGVTLAKVQTKCPVMGGAINKEQYVDHDGQRIYVCCPGCIGKIKAEPAKFIKKLEDEGITLDKTPPPAKSEKKKDAHAGHKH